VRPSEEKLSWKTFFKRDEEIHPSQLRERGTKGKIAILILLLIRGPSLLSHRCSVTGK